MGESCVEPPSWKFFVYLHETGEASRDKLFDLVVKKIVLWYLKHWGLLTGREKTAEGGGFGFGPPPSRAWILVKKVVESLFVGPHRTPPPSGGGGAAPLPTPGTLGKDVAEALVVGEAALGPAPVGREVEESFGTEHQRW